MQDVVEFLVYKAYSWQGGGLGDGRRRGCRLSNRAAAVGEKTRAIGLSGMED
jgi:hypothetical protein